MQDATSSPTISQIFYKNNATNITQRYARAWMMITIMGSDLLSLLLAFLTATWFRLVVLNGIASWFGIELIRPQYININLYRDLWPLPLLLIGLFWLRGLYPGSGLGAVEELRRLVVNTGFIFLGFATITFLVQTQFLYSRSIFTLSCILALVLVPLCRFFTRQTLSKLHAWGEPVAIIGNQSSIAFLLKHFIRNPQIGYMPVICISEDKGLPQQFENLPIISPNYAPDYVEKYNIRCAIIADGENKPTDERLMAYQAIFERVSIINLSAMQQFLWVSVQDLGGLMGYEIKQNLRTTWPCFIKRSLDFILSTIGLVFLLPFFVIIGLVIWLDDRGPVFYRQIRVGKNGKQFNFIKFRTMRVDADTRLKEFLAKDSALKAEWDMYQKLKRDPRITRVGGFLRRFSIDELPQLINVLRGDMSLVGPRPFFVAQQADYGISLTNYVRVRPGLTGMWQVSGRNHTTFIERIKWDEYYVRNWSIWLDLYILACTVWVVIKSEGSY